MESKLKKWADEHVNLVTVIAFLIGGSWGFYLYLTSTDIEDYELQQRIQKAENKVHLLSKSKKAKSQDIEHLKLKIASITEQMNTVDRTIETIRAQPRKENVTDTVVKMQIESTMQGKTRLFNDRATYEHKIIELELELKDIEFDLAQNQQFIDKFK